MNYIQKFFGHLKTVVKHKYWVWRYMCKAEMGWRGLWHDMSKFSPAEFFESVKYYSGTRSPIDACKEAKGVSKAWLHHKGRNQHHYEYWQDNFDNGGTPLIMPRRYAIEMVCDFFGAARAYLGKEFSIEKEVEWWENKKKKPLAMHPQTVLFIDTVMSALSAYGDEVFCRVILEDLYDFSYSLYNPKGQKT